MKNKKEVQNQDLFNILEVASQLTKTNFLLLSEQGNKIKAFTDHDSPCPMKEESLHCMRDYKQIFLNLNKTRTPLFLPCPANYPRFAFPIMRNRNLIGAVIGCRGEKFPKNSMHYFTNLLTNSLNLISKQSYELNSLTSEISSCYEELSFLYDIGESLHIALDLKKRGELLLRSASSIIRSKKAYLVVTEDRNLPAEAKAQAGKPTIVATLGFKTPLNEKNILNEIKNVLADGNPQLKGSTYLLVPLLLEKKIIGVLGLKEKEGRKIFDTKDLKLLSTVASQAAIIIENTRLYQSMEDLFLSVTKSLVSAIEARDPSTKGHSERVMEYAMKISDALNLSEEEKRRLKLASLLHDLGKIGYTDAIFTNPTGSLSQEKWDIVEKHSEVSEKILSPIIQFADIVPSIRWHHERFDGKGYPDGLKGEEIPLLARIVCVADAYDAMTSTRSYRTKFSEDEACQELQKNAGTQFDPTIVKKFISIIKLKCKSLK